MSILVDSELTRQFIFAVRVGSLKVHWDRPVFFRIETQEGESMRIDWSMESSPIICLSILP